jgi:hypothetical protein
MKYSKEKALSKELPQQLTGRQVWRECHCRRNNQRLEMGHDRLIPKKVEKIDNSGSSGIVQRLGHFVSNGVKFQDGRGEQSPSSGGELCFNP